MWKKELGAEQALASIKVDPTDWRHICLCGAKGSIVVLRLTNMAQNKVGGSCREGGAQQFKCTAAQVVQHCEGSTVGAATQWSHLVKGHKCFSILSDVYFSSCIRRCLPCAKYRLLLGGWLYKEQKCEVTPHLRANLLAERIEGRVPGSSEPDTQEATHSAP